MVEDATIAAGEEIHVFPCPTCGGDLEYAPGERVMRCPHCGNEAAIAPLSPWDAQVAEKDYAAAIAGQLPAQEIEETRTVHCGSCGADVEFDEKTHAAECPFCASPLVTDTGVKFVGSAQVYRKNAVLQHGSMQLAPDRALFADLFGEP
ncbi:MAG: NADH pyrophosphatase zinc ribbon domain-containing protein, partial [Rubricella sp.]